MDDDSTQADGTYVEPGEFTARHQLHHDPHHRGRPRRVPRRAGPLPPGRRPCLPLGEPGDHRATPARARTVLSMGICRPDPRPAQLDLRPRPRRRRPGARHRAPADRPTSPASRTTSAASPCRPSSTSRPVRSSPTTTRRSPSTSRPSGRSTTGRVPRSSTRSSCAPRSTRSPTSSSATSTTACTAAGSPATRRAYEAAYDRLFARLDWLTERLATQRYLVGDTITEADVRLFTTLVRFDAVYHGHFKCNRQKLTEMPVLWAYARDLFQTPGFGDTIDFDADQAALLLRAHATSIRPASSRRAQTSANWLTPHGREALGGRPFGDGTPPGPVAPAEVVPGPGAQIGQAGLGHAG